MTLERLRPVAERALDPFVAAADRLGVSPWAVTVVSFGAALGAGGAFALGTPRWYVLGAVLVLLNGWFDLLDGALARELGVDSDAGDLLDHVLDRYADVVVIAGLAAGTGRYALGFAAVTGVLLTSYLGTQAQAVGLTRTYGGALGRADRLAMAGAAGLIAAVVPGPVIGGFGVVAVLLAAFAVVGHLTALQRFLGAWSDLRP